MTNRAKLILTEQPTKTDKAWKLNIKDQAEFWIPSTFIQDYKPWSKEIIIDTWVLDLKGIKYKAL